MTKAIHPLRRYRSFRLFFIGNTLLSIAARSVALIFCWWIVSGESGSSESWQLGVLMTFQSLPYLLLSAVYGPLIDRSNKKTCIVAGAGAQLLVSAAITAVAFAGLDNFWLLCALIFAQSCFMPLVDDSCSSIIPGLVDYEHLPAAAATQASVFETSNIGAALLSTAFMSLAGIKWALLANTGIYLAGLLFVAGIRSEVADIKNVTAASWLGDFKSGWSRITGDRPLLALSGTYIAYAFFLNQTFILIPLLVKHTLNSGVGMVGIIETAFSAAVVLGTLAISARKHIPSVYSILGAAVVLSGVIYVLVAFSQKAMTMVILFFLLGAVFSVFWALSAVVFQLSVPDDFKGRFFSLIGTAAFGIAPLSYLLVGSMIEKWSLTLTISVNGALLSALGILTFLIPRLLNDISAEAKNEF